MSRNSSEKVRSLTVSTPGDSPAHLDSKYLPIRDKRFLCKYLPIMQIFLAMLEWEQDLEGLEKGIVMMGEHLGQISEILPLGKVWDMTLIALKRSLSAPRAQ